MEIVSHHTMTSFLQFLEKSGPKNQRVFTSFSKMGGLDGVGGHILWSLAFHKDSKRHEAIFKESITRETGIEGVNAERFAQVRFGLIRKTLASMGCLVFSARVGDSVDATFDIPDMENKIIEGFKVAASAKSADPKSAGTDVKLNDVAKVQMG